MGGIQQCHSYIVIRFRERNLQIHVWNCVRLYDGPFLKKDKLKHGGLAILEELTYFKTHHGREKIEWLFVFKIKQEMWIVNSKLIKSMLLKLWLKKFFSTNSSQLNIPSGLFVIYEVAKQPIQLP